MYREREIVHVPACDAQLNFKTTYADWEACIYDARFGIHKVHFRQLMGHGDGIERR